MSSQQPSRTGSPSIQLDPPQDFSANTTDASITRSGAPTSSSRTPGSSSSGIAQLMSPPSKSPATMALSPEQHLTSTSNTKAQRGTGARGSLSVSPTPSSSSSSLRAQSLHSSLSHQSNTNSGGGNTNAFSAADAARHLSQEYVAKTSQDMFKKIAEYVKSEMLTTAEDYKLLENMNILTKERYSELAGVAQELMVEVGKLRTTYSDFEPYLARIDEISQQAEMISNIATELDEYTQSLETRLKRISK